MKPTRCDHFPWDGSGSSCQEPRDGQYPGSLLCLDEAGDFLPTSLRSLKGVTTMQARMNNPATVLPDMMQPIQDLFKVTRQGGVPQSVLELVHLRASQINGCSFCVTAGARSARQASETHERIFALSAWPGGPFFTDPERGAPPPTPT